MGRANDWARVVAGVLVLAVVAVAGAAEVPRCSLRVTGGALAGQPLAAEKPQIRVDSGNRITGTVSLHVVNRIPARYPARLLASATWGGSGRGTWVAEESLPAGESDPVVSIDLQAPSKSGVFYIALAVAGPHSHANTMLGTTDGAPQDWSTGDKLAFFFTGKEFDTAMRDGRVSVKSLGRQGPTYGEVAIAGVRVLAGGAPEPTATPVTAPGLTPAATTTTPAPTPPAATATTTGSQPVPAGQRVRVAVWQLSPMAGLDAELMAPLTESMRVALGKTGRFTILARGEMEKVMKEQEISLTKACDTTDCAVEYGQALQVEKIVVGSVAKIGGTYQVVVKLVSVAQGVEERGEEANRAGAEDVLLELVKEAATKLAQ